MKFTITNSPWPNRVPNGTEIKKTEPRSGYAGETNWFCLLDESKIMEEEEDNKFKLFSNEYKITENE